MEEEEEKITVWWGIDVRRKMGEFSRANSREVPVYTIQMERSLDMFVPTERKAICKANKQLYLQFVMHTKAYVTCVKFTVT
jgi:hypothetical protein